MQGVHKAAIAGAVLVLAGAAPGAWAAGGGWYVRVGGVYTQLSDQGWMSQLGPVSTHSKNGGGAEFAFGSDLGRVWAGGGIRGEFVVSWKFNSADYHEISGVQLANTGGHVRALTLMYNLINDFRPESTFDPYLGIGIGYTDIHYAYSGYGGTTAAWVNSTDSVFAYQLLAGVKLQFSQSVALDLGYTLFGTSQLSLNVQGVGQTKTSYRGNSAVLGIDWSF